jgi:hypothetical protein
LAKKYGIKGVPNLSLLGLLFFLTLIPYDFMHLIWENLVKNWVLQWIREFKGLDDSVESYQLLKAIWEAIRESTVVNATGTGSEHRGYGYTRGFCAGFATGTGTGTQICTRTRTCTRGAYY